MGSRFDLDILADPFFSIGNHEAIISIFQRGEVEDMVEHILADALVEENIVTFLDGDDHVFGRRVEKAALVEIVSVKAAKRDKIALRIVREYMVIGFSVFNKPDRIRFVRQHSS